MHVSSNSVRQTKLRVVRFVAETKLQRVYSKSCLMHKLNKYRNGKACVYRSSLYLAFQVELKAQDTISTEIRSVEVCNMDQSDTYWANRNPPSEPSIISIVKQGKAQRCSRTITPCRTLPNTLFIILESYSYGDKGMLPVDTTVLLQKYSIEFELP